MPYQILAFITHGKNIKSLYNNNKFQISAPNKLFGSSIEISPTNHIFLKTFNSEYNEIKVWFTDQNSQPLETEDRINLYKDCTYKNEIFN